MQFLANENFPFPSIQLLRNAGWKVVSIAETFSGISDLEVLKRAVDNQQIILTFDADYGKLLFKYQLKPPPAVVYFRFKGTHPTSAGRLLIDILNLNQVELLNNFTVVGENSIRQRKLV